MKTQHYFFITCILLCGTMGNALARVLTVSNHPQGGAQYSNLAEAYADAGDGDTLLIEGTGVAYTIHPSHLNYWEYTPWGKPLVVIGAGFNTDKSSFLKTIIRCGGADSYNHSYVGISNIRFYGIRFQGNITLTNAVNNVVFEDCEFPGYLGNDGNSAVSGLQVRNCLFTSTDRNIGIASSAAYNMVIFNSIFNGYIDGANNIVNTAVIDHCLFLRNSSPAHGVIYRLRNSSVTNCIFMNTTTLVTETSGCQFGNNIIQATSLSLPEGNTTAANLNDTDPQFVSYTPGQLYSPLHDYHLQAGSPGLSGSGDGTQIGLHGGTARFSEKGEPLIVPVVRSVNIANPNIQPNGTLNVNIRAGRPNPVD